MNSFRLILVGVTIASLVLQSAVFASQIGTGTVVGSGALTAPINWNDTFVGSSASGTINGLVVTARILPTLTMTVSGSGTIALGNLSSSAYSTGTVSLEVGTNAINGASITARSANGGLNNTTNPSTQINSLATDGFTDSYKFNSVLGTTDSTALGFAQSGALNVEVTSSGTSNTIYSSNKPQPVTGVDDLTFSVSAKPNAQTPAGDYRDTVVFTVTGNF